MNNLRYFKETAVVALFALVAAYFLAGPQAMAIVAILSVLETSLSFDNAVVNAKVLKHMDAKWRRLFVTLGMLIAVGAMRLLLPLAIVAIMAHMGMWDVFLMAKNAPDQYAAVLTSAHHEVAAFGGAFLLMVFLKFFVDEEKDEHWLHVLEAPLTRLGKMEAVQVALTLVTLLVSAAFLPSEQKLSFVVAGAWGLVTYVVVDGLGAWMESKNEEREASAGAAVAVAKQGLMGFLYLEVLDASFSFDGVIGAFALSNNLFTIALGLGVGAMFVRSFTLMLVDKGTLDTLRYLEHGAFWAIGLLAAFMFIGVHVHIPEVVTGLMGAALIVIAAWSSKRANRLEAASDPA